MPLKFRCYRCNQLLGASRSKVGTVISCPKCGSALVVPEPDEETAPVARSVKPVLGALTSGGPQDTESILDIRPEDIRVEPGIELLRPDVDEELETVANDDDADIANETVAPPPEPEETVVVTKAPVPVPPPLPEAVPPIQVEVPPDVRPHESYGRTRARDVVLPRSVVLAWSLFVLAALALAFGAGLLAGHYVWRVHEPVTRLNVAPAPK